MASADSVANAKGPVPSAIHVELEIEDKDINDVSKEPDVELSYSSKIERKIDIRLIPMLALMQSCNMIDRLNIGQAKVVGMATDLKMTGAAYSICLFVFFITFITCELPANLALIKFGVKNVLFCITFGFGLMTLAQGFVHSWGVLAMCRVFLGVFEAGGWPATALLITSWYPRYRSQRKVMGMYFVGLLASGFSGVLAYGFARMDGIGNLAGWRWIFTMGSIITFISATCIYFIVPDFPDRATFLSAPEKDAVLRYLRADRGNVETVPITMTIVKSILKEWRPWFTSLMYVSTSSLLYAMGFFVPTILTGMGYTGLQATLYSAPPYCVAAVSALLMAFISDKLQRRLPTIIFQACLGILGLALCSQTQLSVGARYTGLVLATTGAQSNVPTIVVFGQNNSYGHAKMTIVSAMTITGGGIGGLIASLVFMSKEAPTYQTGLGVTMALQALLVANCVTHWILNARDNRLADRGQKVLCDTEGWRYTL